MTTTQTAHHANRATLVALAIAIALAAIVARGETIAACMDAGFSPAYCAQYIAAAQNPDHADN